jgi:hypothetical protein
MSKFPFHMQMLNGWIKKFYIFYYHYTVYYSHEGNQIIFIFFSKIAKENETMLYTSDI